jgi:hypothetical protein
VVETAVKAENRAYMGVNIIIKINDKIEYEIFTHYLFGMFCLTKRNRWVYIACSKRIKPLIEWIEKTHNVKVELPHDIEKHESYSIEETKRILRKYPSWRADPSESCIPVI